jgi:NTP pyrophosphatase (non-canonical NTP hydrolase)
MRTHELATLGTRQVVLSLDEWKRIVHGFRALEVEINQLIETKALDARPEVITLARAMEERLRANEAKGHWAGCTFGYLFTRLHEELSELSNAMAFEHESPEQVWREAADVANFVMMLADNYQRQHPEM